MHVIKRKAIEPREVIKPPAPQACLPLRVEDIFRIPIETQGGNTFELFGLQFRLITFYGRICKVVKNEKWNQRYGMYSVDDGSGRIVVHYNHLKKEFKGETSYPHCDHNLISLSPSRNLYGNSQIRERDETETE